MSLVDLILELIKDAVAAHPQLAPWIADWNSGCETQILIDPTGLTPIFKGSSKSPAFWVEEDDPEGDHYNPDSYIEHRNIRIPWKSNTSNPSWRDQAVNPDIAKRFAYFGTSGWNWKKKKSMWVGFDFDSVANHSEGLEQAELGEVLRKALELDYVTARTSKSGKGYHILVYLDPWVDTRTHSDHALLAQHVLGRMSSDTGFNFHSAADCCGSILWHWSRDLHHDGLKHINSK